MNEEELLHTKIDNFFEERGGPVFVTVEFGFVSPDFYLFEDKDQLFELLCRLKEGASVRCTSAWDIDHSSGKTLVFEA